MWGNSFEKKFTCNNKKSLDFPWQNDTRLKQPSSFFVCNFFLSAYERFSHMYKIQIILACFDIIISKYLNLEEYHFVIVYLRWGLFLLVPLTKQF